MINKRIRKLQSKLTHTLNATVANAPAEIFGLNGFGIETKITVDVIDFLEDCNLADRVNAFDLISRAKRVAKTGSYAAYKRTLTRRR